MCVVLPYENDVGTGGEGALEKVNSPASADEQRASPSIIRGRFRDLDSSPGDGIDSWTVNDEEGPLLSTPPSIRDKTMEVKWGYVFRLVDNCLFESCR